ncbi:hypothetical protein FPSE_09913 [Fusarium pseudograminearum CS3096]|uniref:Uncharacterized protein n=1 Tax=Fusarium pseudograminearum (strain CS3096) TaxID=1028729 RepID=K3VY21_FUSPC|nr:hypothetical protein FPSE_09913 [Fusarium pseudograminearum CS3096]EKJ69890.1 hypothetical protein FPSE_09913 [Fusarium pseudograminearum CS3096]
MGVDISHAPKRLSCIKWWAMRARKRHDMTAFWVQGAAVSSRTRRGQEFGVLGCLFEDIPDQAGTLPRKPTCYHVPSLVSNGSKYKQDASNVSVAKLTPLGSSQPPVGGGTLITIFPALHEEGTGLMCHRRVLVLPDMTKCTIILATATATATLHLLSGTHLFTQNEAITETGHPSIGCRTRSGIPTIHLDWFP